MPQAAWGIHLSALVLTRLYKLWNEEGKKTDMILIQNSNLGFLNSSQTLLPLELLCVWAKSEHILACIVLQDSVAGKGMQMHPPLVAS